MRDCKFSLSFRLWVLMATRTDKDNNAYSKLPLFVIGDTETHTLYLAVLFNLVPCAALLHNENNEGQS